MAILMQADLEARLSVATVRALYDDDQSGDADAAPVAQLLEDAESYVLGAIWGAGGVYVGAVPDPPPAELKRLCLDAAVAYAAQRFPEVVKRDWQALFEWLKGELKDLRDGVRGLGPQETATTDAANQGAVVESDNPTETATKRFFVSGMGDF